MRTKWAALSAVLALTVLLSGCGTEGASQNAARLMQERLLSGAAPLAEEAHGLPRTLTLESVHYGSFSAPGAAELCALFKYDAPVHVEGLDRTLGVVYTADDLKVVAGCDFMADDVQLSFLPADDGTERIFYLGASTNHGLTSYALGLYKVSGAAWEPMETGLPAVEEGGAVYSAKENVLFITPEDACTAYGWNRETEGFEQADMSQGGNIAGGTGAYVFPGGARNASEYFTVEELDLPDAINGMDYSFYDFIGENLLMVQLYDTLNNAPVQREFGALNILTGGYKTLFEVPEGENYSLSCTDGRYAVCSRHDEASGDYSLRLFDLSTGEGRDVYTYAPVYRGIEVPAGPKVLLDGCLYFSDVMPGENATGRMRLLCYNIGTGSLSTVAENARDPVVVDGWLAWVTGPDEQGNYALAGADGETTPLEERPVSLTAAGGKLYSWYKREPGALYTTTCLAELETGRSLMETTMSVDQLRGGSLALAWYNYGEEVPALWLPEEGCAAVFSGMDKACNSFRLGEKEIFLHCGHDDAPSRYYRILPK